MGYKWHEGCWRSEEEAGDIDDSNFKMYATLAAIGLGIFFIICSVKSGTILGYFCGGALLAICWRAVLQILLVIFTLALMLGIGVGILYLISLCLK